MKIQFASEIHLEFRQNSEYLAGNPLDVIGDILVLAGDVTYLGKDKYLRHPFFDWCSENFKQTFIVPGNHEYYDVAEIESRTLTICRLVVHAAELRDDAATVAGY